MWTHKIFNSFALLTDPQEWNKKSLDPTFDENLGKSMVVQSVINTLARKHHKIITKVFANI